MMFRIKKSVCYGKTVIVKTRAKGVLAIGGDVIVEGSVSGDVAAVGGSVIQRDGAYIGGDVFAVGRGISAGESEPTA
jgi:cytoskeletal protein CcmA (bactofilin family)